MKDETNETPMGEREALEERVLALLLDELNPNETEAIEARLAEDVNLRTYRDRLEHSLDLVGEAARSKAALDMEAFRLDPRRRRELEELWIEKQPEDGFEDENEPVPFEIVAENTSKSRGKFLRFLPMIAAAALAVGATGIIVRTVLQQAEHGEDMALASEDASEAVLENKPVEIVHKSSKGKEVEGTLQKIKLQQRQESLPGSDPGSVAAAPFTEPKALALSAVSEVLDAEVARESEEILNDRLANDIDNLNEELRIEGERLARELHPLKETQRDSVTVIGADVELDEALAFAERNKLPTGTVRSFVEADTLDKRTASVSGGASAVGAGLRLPRRPNAPKAGAGINSNPQSRVSALTLASSVDDQIVSADFSEAKRIAATIASDGSNALEHPAGQPAPTGEAFRYLADENPKKARDKDPVSRREPSRKSPTPSSGPTQTPPAVNLKPTTVDSIARDEDVSDLDAPNPSTGKLARRKAHVADGGFSSVEEGVQPFPSLHEPSVASGAVAGEKGARKNLTAFADFGLDVAPGDRNEVHSNKAPTKKNQGVAGDDEKEDRKLGGELASREEFEKFSESQVLEDDLALNTSSDLPVNGLVEGLASVDEVSKLVISSDTENPMPKTLDALPNPVVVASAPETKSSGSSSEQEPAPTPESETDTHLLSAPNRFALITGVLFAIAAVVGFYRLRKKA